MLSRRVKLVVIQFYVDVVNITIGYIGLHREARLEELVFGGRLSNLLTHTKKKQRHQEECSICYKMCQLYPTHLIHPKP